MTGEARDAARAVFDAVEAFNVAAIQACKAGVTVVATVSDTGRMSFEEGDRPELSVRLTQRILPDRRLDGIQR